MQSIAERVRDLRAAKRLTAQQLGDRLTEVGVNWDRFTVASLENGKRQNVTVVELLALAYVLDVAPVHLMVPIDERPFRVLPDREVEAREARAWVRGEYPLPGVNRKRYFAEVPDQEWSPPVATDDPQRAARILNLAARGGGEVTITQPDGSKITLTRRDTDGDG